MNLSKDALQTLSDAMDELTDGFAHLPSFEPVLGNAGNAEALAEAARRMHDNFPYPHPYYMGQMLKPPHPVAHLAYAMAMNLNPNNHALDGGRASSQMEKDAVAEIARMFGWERFMGHLCGGGTMANFEALWVARELNKESGRRTVLASSQSHYTHSRLSSVLEMPFRSVAVDDVGAMSISALREELEQGDVGCIVATLGTTLAGSVDPLPGILKLAKEFDCRVHVDTAYGGYFTLANNLDPYTRMAYDAISEADSIVVDPHKHGLQPYGCGCVLFKDPSVGRIYNHDSPYTYFSSDELHLGEISLECSRAGASAVALWTTQQSFPLSADGAFAMSLSQCRQAAMSFHYWLHESAYFTPLFGPQLDIVCWIVNAATASEVSVLSQRVFDEAATRDLHLAVATVPYAMCTALQCVEDWDQEQVTILRACIMKPEHQIHMDDITQLLEASVKAVLG